jgi:hypothetical protein
MLKWLMHDDQAALFNALVALALNGIFLGLVALVTRPLGRLSLVFELGRGYGVLWIVLIISSLLLTLFHRLSRMDLDSRYTPYVISTLAPSSLLQLGWTAFAAQTARTFSTGEALWISALFYLLGFLSCWIASQVIATSYAGAIYKLTNLALIPFGFLVFSLWPVGGQMLFGWF